MPITFHDAAAYFSAEEWTQLHEWQKELYRNVMKEIHQALISLGPIIAATVFSLQAKENRDLYVVNNQDSERRQCVNPSARHEVFDNGPLFNRNKREEAHFCDPDDSERTDIDEPTIEHEAISFVLKEEEEHYPIDNQDSRRGECSISSKGFGQVALSRVFPKREETSGDTKSRSMYEWNPENPEHHILSGNGKNVDAAHPEQSEISRTVNTFETNQTIHTQSKGQIKSEQFVNKMNDSPQPGTHTDQLPHTGTENVKNVPLRSNQQTPTGLAPYTCTECGKVFRKHSRLICHLRVHVGEMPYICMECGKGFNNNSNFKRHMRIHTGNKPYTCNTCGKDFTQANHLHVHQRLHTGEKPHACPICGKLFAHDSSLSKHQLTHTGRKPFQCSVCCKSFRQRGHLTIHLRAHTGERPFHCTKCEKTFIVKKHLIKHQTTHIDMNPPFPV